MLKVRFQIDLPGHTASVAQAFPDYVACHDKRPWSHYAAEPPAGTPSVEHSSTQLTDWRRAGQLKLGNPDVLAFAERVVRDAAQLSPAALFSTGGDEVVRTDPLHHIQVDIDIVRSQNTACYLEDPETAAAMLANSTTLDSLLSTFVHSLHDAVRKESKIPVVWEEMILKHDLGLKNDTIVTVWISSVRTLCLACVALEN